MMQMAKIAAALGRCGRRAALRVGLTDTHDRRACHRLVAMLGDLNFARGRGR